MPLQNIPLKYKIVNVRSNFKVSERNKTMYETVKTVKGIAITRMKNTHGQYYVSLREGKGWKEFHTFRTIKAAVKFIEETC